MKAFLFSIGMVALTCGFISASYADNTLKQPVQLEHDAYLAAKNMCLHAVYAHKDTLGENDALLLLAQCSSGAFDTVISGLGHDISGSTSLITTEQGREVVLDWEKGARDSVQYVEIIRAHESNHKAKGE